MEDAKNPTKKATLLWVDLEMTGLIPGKDKIIEVAAIATDWEFNKIAEYTAVVKVDSGFMHERMVGEFWDKNSESRDALIAQNENGKTIAEVETELIKFLDDNFETQSIKNDDKGKGKIILAGNSIHQDKRFIDVEMPKLAKRLHYRLFDVSAWKVYFEGAMDRHFVKRELHRAFDDIEGSIEEMKWYLTYLK
ncbi:oligoribonuclease [Candidatus Saccharibacteria bacterium]|nr:oligoribonuclease [Candidatus Saccharibacteria bacterium]